METDVRRYNKAELAWRSSSVSLKTKVKRKYNYIWLPKIFYWHKWLFCIYWNWIWRIAIHRHSQNEVFCDCVRVDLVVLCYVHVSFVIYLSRSVHAEKCMVLFLFLFFLSSVLFPHTYFVVVNANQSRGNYLKNWFPATLQIIHNYYAPNWRSGIA